MFLANSGGSVCEREHKQQETPMQIRCAMKNQAGTKDQIQMAKKLLFHKATKMAKKAKYIKNCKAKLTMRLTIPNI